MTCAHTQRNVCFIFMFYVSDSTPYLYNTQSGCSCFPAYKDRYSAFSQSSHSVLLSASKSYNILFLWPLVGSGNKLLTYDHFNWHCKHIYTSSSSRSCVLHFLSCFACCRAVFAMLHFCWSNFQLCVCHNVVLCSG